MGKILTESEVASIGGVSTGYTNNKCCTASRANTLNCYVTSPSNAASNLLITGVSKKSPPDFILSWRGEGMTTPVFQIYSSTTYNTSNLLFSSGRYGNASQTSGSVGVHWIADGTAKSIYIFENPGYTQVSLTGYMGNPYLNKTTFSNYTMIPLTTTFNTSDYKDGNRTLYINFYK